MKTFTPKPADLTHDWYVIDATDVVLGRLASQAAILLRGKNKPTYAPHADSGNHVIILNADKIALTGNKLGKELYMHSGRPGGLRRDSYGSCSRPTLSASSSPLSRACCRRIVWPRSSWIASTSSVAPSIRTLARSRRFSRSLRSRSRLSEPKGDKKHG